VASSSKQGILRLVLVGAVLVGAILIVHGHTDVIGTFIDRHTGWGLLLYLLLNVLDAVLLPGATLPLIPVATTVWGPIPAALATTAGWTGGSLIAFLIARRWGAPLVRRLTSMQRIRDMRRFIPDDLFWSVLLVRLILPMDVISYVLGLFTDMSWAKYALATALGLTPAAFLLAYLGSLPNGYWIVASGASVAIVVATVVAARSGQRRERATSARS
jgi:uncharacterized membrane protein YdjX (TVP38/TMEM64 family)